MSIFPTQSLHFHIPPDLAWIPALWPSLASLGNYETERKAVQAEQIKRKTEYQVSETK